MTDPEKLTKPEMPSPRKPRFHAIMRRVERVVEYVALVVHIVVIGEGFRHILIIAMA